MRELLEQTKLFDTNNYEANKGSKTGILLIHGFTNTTYELKKLFNYLSINMELHGPKNAFIKR